MPITGPGPSPDGKCCNVTVMTRCKGCPYYQSAEYKASVGDASASVPNREQRLSEYAQALEAAGYTVTPPDPLAADREFLAGMLDVFGMKGTGTQIRLGQFLEDDKIAAAMAYLRQNKGRL